MEALLALIGLFLFITAVVVPWVALTKAGAATRMAAELEAELTRQERDTRRELDKLALSLDSLRREIRRNSAAVEPPSQPAPKVEAKTAEAPAKVAPPPIPARTAEAEAPAVTPAAAREDFGSALVSAKLDKPAVEPPPLPPEIPAPAPKRPEPAPSFARGDEPEAPEHAKPFNWEQFLGAKLPTWAGCILIAIGVGYGIKWSIEHAVIPPAVRAAFGFITGLGLIIGGLRLNRERYAVTQQSLASAGTLTLYAVTFACASKSLWNLLPAPAAFATMSLITAAAFLMAVRLGAPAIAILGIAGGFLTPPLLSTGADNPFGLFGYIALLKIGLLAVALRRRWHFLAALGAAGTALTQFGWWIKYYDRGAYAHTADIYIPMGVFLLMQLIFVVAAHIAKRRERTNDWLSASGLALSGTAMLAALPFVDAPFLSASPAIPFAYAFLVEAGVFALASADGRVRWAGPVSGGFVFLLLFGWTADALTQDNLYTGLALHLAFAVVHTAVPLTLRRMGKIAQTPAWCGVFPVLALLMTLIPAFRFDSLLVWPLLLIVDALAVVIAIATAALAPVLLVLALTLVAAGATLTHVGADLAGLNTWLLLLGGASMAFMALGVSLWKKFAPGSTSSGLPEAPANSNAAVAALLAPASGILPFLLLVMATTRLPLADPSPVFGLALLLAVLLLGLGKLLRMPSLAPVALGGAALTQFAWMSANLNPGMTPALPIAWQLVFCATFFAYPFVFHKDFEDRVAPWAASVASLGVHFLMLHTTRGLLRPHAFPGLEPAAFALPALAGLALVMRRTPTTAPARLTQLALYGGGALAFITAVFPLQFDRQWLTLAWALEGAALCALFRRVPHAGLRLAGVALMIVAFARLALNPAVLGYHARGELPIWNWYLYAYAVAAASLFAGARMLAPPRNLVLGSDVTPLLRAGGVILMFLLLNIEIADFFSEPGAAVLTFDFSGNLARDLTYSIGWGLFSLGLLLAGILRKLRAARYAAIALLLVTLGKVFLHDLTELSELHRVGAALGVAAILLVSGFLYQKFLAEERA